MSTLTHWLLGALAGSILFLGLVLAAAPLAFTKTVETNTNIGGHVIINTCSDLQLPFSARPIHE